MHHFEGNFQGFTGSKLYYQSWIPEGKIKAVIIIAHGIAEHSGRYQNTAE
jgi:alpha-beta hydrolase superfamily lysophospholipase